MKYRKKPVVVDAEQDHEKADKFFADEPTCPNGIVFEQTYERVE